MWGCARQRDLAHRLVNPKTCIRRVPQHALAGPPRVVHFAHQRGCAPSRIDSNRPAWEGIPACFLSLKRVAQSIEFCIVHASSDRPDWHKFASKGVMRAKHQGTEIATDAENFRPRGSEFVSVVTQQPDVPAVPDNGHSDAIPLELELPPVASGQGVCASGHGLECLGDQRVSSTTRRVPRDRYRTRSKLRDRAARSPP